MNLPQNTAYERGSEYTCTSYLSVYKKYQIASLLCIFETTVGVLYECNTFMTESEHYKHLGVNDNKYLSKKICIHDSTHKLKFKYVSCLLNSTLAKRNSHLEHKTFVVLVRFLFVFVLGCFCKSVRLIVSSEHPALCLFSLCTVARRFRLNSRIATYTNMHGI